jgi:hypothetical protein
VQNRERQLGAEMTIEGIKEFELVRDFLYARMRGVVRPYRTLQRPARKCMGDDRSRGRPSGKSRVS